MNAALHLPTKRSEAMAETKTRRTAADLARRGYGTAKLGALDVDAIVFGRRLPPAGSYRLRTIGYRSHWVATILREDDGWRAYYTDYATEEGLARAEARRHTYGEPITGVCATTIEAAHQLLDRLEETGQIDYWRGAR